jgi:hypothetical protein
VPAISRPPISAMHSVERRDPMSRLMAVLY